MPLPRLLNNACGLPTDDLAVWDRDPSDPAVRTL